MTHEAEEREPATGVMRPTPSPVLGALAVVGLVLGWLLHPVSERVTGTAPVVTWLQPVALWVVAGLLGYLAWQTWRTVRARGLLWPHQAVNRLVLARACALVGAFVGGGYLGYALSWIDSSAVLAEQRLVRSLVAAAAATAIVAAALLLERACRVRIDDSEPDPYGESETA